MDSPTLSEIRNALEDEVEGYRTLTANLNEEEKNKIVEHLAADMLSDGPRTAFVGKARCVIKCNAKAFVCGVRADGNLLKLAECIGELYRCLKRC